MSTEPVPVAVPHPPPTNPKPVPPPPTAQPVAPPPVATKQPIPPTGLKPPPQAVKLQIRDPNFHPYRHQSAQKKRIAAAAAAPKRRCCTCCCCLIWLILTLLILSVVVAATCGVFWILFKPQRPKFTVASLKLANLNLTGNLDTDASGRLFTSGNLTISARNPNSKITALYEETAMSVFSKSNVMIADSIFQPFSSSPGNSTVIRFVFRSWRTLDLESARGLRSDLTGKSEMWSRLELETKMGVQIGKWKSRKIGIRVTCGGLRVKIPKTGTKKGSSADAAISDDGKCKVDLSIKIWGFTF
ncbi:unnamed protein product [Rhodiola kirilowii]